MAPLTAKGRPSIPNPGFEPMRSSSRPRGRRSPAPGLDSEPTAGLSSRPTLRARLQSAALVALGVAIGGFVAVPASHLIGHEDDHIHVGGSVVYVDPDDPEAVRRARRATEAPSADSPGPGGDPSDGDPSDGGEGDAHGDGSLAHFGAAITASVSSPPVTPPRARKPDPVRAPESVEPAPPERSGRRARAPPAR